MSARSGARGAVTVERITVWGLAALVVAALAALVGPGMAFADATPTADFEGSYDDATGTLTVTHTGGTELTDRNTRSVALVVTDTDGGTTTRLVWADESALPLTEGDAVTVDDPSTDADGDGNFLDAEHSVGFYLEPGDTADVVWTGRRPGAPSIQTETLGTVTVANSTG